MSNRYFDTEYCAICEETRQSIYDSEHERDSSNDFRYCLTCGGYYSGLTMEWEPGDVDEFILNLKQQDESDVHPSE